MWIAYAKFELGNYTTDDDSPDTIALARRVFERGNDALRSSGDKESRALLLEAWRDFETEKGDEESQAKIMDKMPRRIKRRRRIVGEDGVIIFNINEISSLFIHPTLLFQTEEGWEEVFDFVFPEDESQRPNLKLLASAKAWKKQKETVQDVDTNGETVSSDSTPS